MVPGTLEGATTSTEAREVRTQTSQESIDKHVEKRESAHGTHIRCVAGKGCELNLNRNSLDRYNPSERPWNHDLDKRRLQQSRHFQ